MTSPTPPHNVDAADPDDPDDAAANIYALRVPLSAVAEGGVTAVTVYLQRFKRGQARVYRDELRRHNGQPQAALRAAKVKFGSYDEARAALPRPRRAVACELIAAVLREPWEHSWASMLRRAEAYPCERLDFWTMRIREGRLGAEQRHAIAKVFIDEPLLGGADRGVILDYLAHHHDAASGEALGEALRDVAPCEEGACALRGALDRNMPELSSGGWYATDALFDALVAAAGSLCPAMLAPVEGLAPPGRLTGLAASANPCAGLVMLEARLAQWARRVLLDGRTDPPGEPDAEELHTVARVLVGAARELLWHGASGADEDALARLSQPHREHFEHAVWQLLYNRQERNGRWGRG